MKLRLRWKIMTFTVLPLVTLALSTLWIVNWSITRHVQTGIQDDLRRASAVLENVLAARAQSLAIGGQMTVKDPRFFSVLTIPGSHRDPQLRATVAAWPVTSTRSRRPICSKSPTRADRCWPRWDATSRCRATATRWCARRLRGARCRES
jgi:hypothetical protein